MIWPHHLVEASGVACVVRYWFILHDLTNLSNCVIIRLSAAEGLYPYLPPVYRGPYTPPSVRRARERAHAARIIFKIRLAATMAYRASGVHRPHSAGPVCVLACSLINMGCPSISSLHTEHWNSSRSTAVLLRMYGLATICLPRPPFQVLLGDREPRTTLYMLGHLAPGAFNRAGADGAQVPHQVGLYVYYRAPRSGGHASRGNSGFGQGRLPPATVHLVHHNS